MPLLGPADPLPHHPHRIVVAGPSGAGKTTVASRLGVAFGLPHTEIDSLFHGRGWIKRETFLSDVRDLVATEEWVTEWQYDSARPLLIARADLLVWLDLPRRVVMSQIVRRTVRRRLRREPLWGVNLEPPLWTFFVNREHIVRWAWTTYPLSAQRVGQVRAERSELPVVRLSIRADVEKWLSGPVRQV